MSVMTVLLVYGSLASLESLRWRKETSAAAALPLFLLLIEARGFGLLDGLVAVLTGSLIGTDEGLLLALELREADLPGDALVAAVLTVSSNG